MDLCVSSVFSAFFTLFGSLGVIVGFSTTTPVMPIKCFTVMFAITFVQQVIGLVLFVLFLSEWYIIFKCLLVVLSVGMILGKTWNMQQLKIALVYLCVYDLIYIGTASVMIYNAVTSKICSQPYVIAVEFCMIFYLASSFIVVCVSLSIEFVVVKKTLPAIPFYCRNVILTYRYMMPDNARTLTNSTVVLWDKEMATSLDEGRVLSQGVYGFDRIKTLLNGQHREALLEYNGCVMYVRRHNIFSSCFQCMVLPLIMGTCFTNSTVSQPRSSIKTHYVELHSTISRDPSSVVDLDVAENNDGVDTAQTTPSLQQLYRKQLVDACLERERRDSGGSMRNTMFDLMVHTNNSTCQGMTQGAIDIINNQSTIKKVHMSTGRLEDNSLQIFRDLSGEFSRHHPQSARQAENIAVVSQRTSTSRQSFKPSYCLALGFSNGKLTLVPNESNCSGYSQTSRSMLHSSHSMIYSNDLNIRRAGCGSILSKAEPGLDPSTSRSFDGTTSCLYKGCNYQKVYRPEDMLSTISDNADPSIIHSNSSEDSGLEDHYKAIKPSIPGIATLAKTQLHDRSKTSVPRGVTSSGDNFASSAYCQSDNICDSLLKDELVSPLSVISGKHSIDSGGDIPNSRHTDESASRKSFTNAEFSICQANKKHVSSKDVLTATDMLTYEERLDIVRYWVLCRCKRKDVQFVVAVNRRQVLLDTESILVNTPLRHHIYPIHVRFINETAFDAGGLCREYLSLLAGQLFSPAFIPAAPTESDDSAGSVPNSNILIADNQTITMAPSCTVMVAYTMGWCVGKCLFHGISIPQQLSPMFLSIMMGVSPTIEDIASFEPGLANVIRDAEYDDGSFHCLRAEIPALGKWRMRRPWYKTIFLKAFQADECSGDTQSAAICSSQNSFVPITNLSDLAKGFKRVNSLPTIKVRAIDTLQVVLAKYYPMSRKAVRGLQRGFKSCIPQPADFFLDQPLLRKTTIGNVVIDLVDWKRYTHVLGFPFDSMVPFWFWQILEENRDLPSLVLFFACGINAPPSTGFQGLGKPLFSGQPAHPFTIVPCSKTRLPVAHTCVNRLELPLVDSKQELEFSLRKSTKFGRTLDIV